MQLCALDFFQKIRSVMVPRFGFFPGFTDKGLYEEFSSVKQIFNVKGSDIEWQYLCQNSSPYVPVSKYEFTKTLVLSQLSDSEFPIR